ncbi:hypothetical protein E2320_013006, partial [Naja naja]
PVSEASDGKELLEGQAVNLAHPKVARSVGGHRHNAWRRMKDCLGMARPVVSSLLDQLCLSRASIHGRV